MKKNDVIELFTTLSASRVAAAAELVQKAESAQSADEKKELLNAAKKNSTHAKYLQRILNSEALLDAVASQVVSLKITAEQIKDIESDAYSLRKFAELLISFAQKRKVADEHSFSEALALLASGVTSADAVSFGKKMRNIHGAPYGARQAQMSLKLLERLNAMKATRDSRTLVFSVNADSAVFKRIMKAYE